MLALEYISHETSFKIVAGKTDDIAWGFYVELYDVLGHPLWNGDGNKINCNPLFKRSSIDIPKLQSMCDYYNKKGLWHFYSEVKQLGPEQHFFVLICDSETNIPDEKRMDINALLVALNTGKDFAVLQENLREFSSKLRQHYDVIACLDCSKAMKIGRKNCNRFCRFCGRSQEEGAKFSKDAHVVSKMLGNTSVLSVFECDDCNGGVFNRLGSSLVTYFKFLRTMMGVRGRGGIANIEEPDYSMSNKTGTDIVITIKRDNVEDVPAGDGASKKILTIPCGRLIPQHLYRLFSKFAISVIEDSEFEYNKFKRLANWIVGKTSHNGAMPLVAVRTEPRWNPRVPRITVYRRRAEADKTVPLYLCDFFAVCERFMFELPFMEDEMVLKDKDAWQNFWEDCTVICDDEKWELIDFSSIAEQDFTNKIILHAMAQ